MAEQARGTDDLFGRRPEEFTAARNALAKRLKADGNSEEAARVSALRRPSHTAWALNQLARSRPDLVDAVISAGDRLRGATEQAMSGDRSGFQQAQMEERSAIQAAVVTAAKLLVEGGAKDGEAARQRLTETLRAATVELDVADRLRRGVLETDVSAPGFGLGGLDAVPTFEGKPSLTGDGELTAREQRRVDRIARLERELLDATARLEVVQAEADEAAARVSDLRRLVVEAQREVGVAQKRLDEERKRQK